MSKSRKARRNTRPASAAGRRPRRGAAVLLGAGAFAAAAALWWEPGRHDSPPAALAPPTVTRATTPPLAPAGPALAALRKLEGRWVRTDGGYVVEVRGVEQGGKVDAAYFNPRPIHVARAEASLDGEAVSLFIELRDVNYPGSSYHLSLSSDASQMRGTYYQAVAQETYDVLFVRR